MNIIKKLNIHNNPLCSHSNVHASSLSNLADSSATTFYSLLALNVPSEPKNISTRILTLSICITGGILYWSYSAGLVSYLTVEKYDYPIKTFNVSAFALLETSTYF